MSSSTLLLWLVWLLSALSHASSTRSSKPNVVLLFLDDTGWGDIGANFDDDAAGSPSETPHINALARDGMRFTDGHAGASVCGPSRSAIMTGRLGIRNGITHNSGYKWLAGLPRSELTLGEMMKSGGYDTLMLGKWHLGFQPGFHPSFRGFDEYFGLPFSNDVGCLSVTAWNWEPFVHGATYPQGEQPEPRCNCTAPPPAGTVFDASTVAAASVVTSEMRREAIRLLGDDFEPFAAVLPQACAAAGAGRQPPVGSQSARISCANYKQTAGVIYTGKKPSASSTATSGAACCTLCAVGMSDSNQANQCVAWSFSNGTCSQWESFPGEPQPVPGASSGYDGAIRPDPHGGLLAALATPLYESLKPNCSAKQPCEMLTGGRQGPNCCNQDIIEQPVNLTTLSTRYAERAVEYIAQPRNAQRSFFIYAAFAHMHVPQAYEPQWMHTSTRNSIFGDALREADAAVGAIRLALDHTGKAADTLLVLSADNGPWNVKCSLAGSQGPFTGAWQKDPEGGGGGATGKFTTWCEHSIHPFSVIQSFRLSETSGPAREGGHREPFIAYMPGRITPGALSHVLASTMDFMPTFAALAGVTLPTDRVFDGKDLSPVLFDNATIHHEFLFHPKGNGLPDAAGFVVSGRRYKVFWGTAGTQDCNETSSLGSMFAQLQARSLVHDTPLVFDLDSDPAESTPIQPSVELLAHFENVRAQFNASVHTTFRSVGDYNQTADPAMEPCCDAHHPECMCAQ